MRKFKCIETGAILLVKNEFVIKQMLKDAAYEEVKEEIGTTKDNDLSRLNKDGLVKVATDLGITVEETMTKKEIIALIEATNN